LVCLAALQHFLATDYVTPILGVWQNSGGGLVEVVDDGDAGDEAQLVSQEAALLNETAGSVV
jgi:hypothetical protein